jgi:uncharacterized Ntn-hydrolase superfamily protein
MRLGDLQKDPVIKRDYAGQTIAVDENKNILASGINAEHALQAALSLENSPPEEKISLIDIPGRDLAFTR